MIIVEVENLVGKEVELLVSGHFFSGRVTTVDPATNTLTLKEDLEVDAIIDIEHIAMLKVQ